MRRVNISFILTIFSLIIVLPTLYGDSSPPAAAVCTADQLFTKKILAHVRSCIAHSEELQNKDAVLSLVRAVEANSSVIETGADDLRNKYVYAQGCFEHVLACAQTRGDIDQLIGIIHTPTIATPLCVEPEGPVEDLLDPSIRHDLDKRLTVRSRAQIVREYLSKGGKLYIVYPEGGQAKRTPEQLNVYREELDKYSGKLIDWALSGQALEPDMIGATYLFRTPERHIFCFSVKSRQAIDIQSQAEWGLWFGLIEDKVIAERVNAVLDYLSTHKGPDIRQEIFGY